MKTNLNISERLHKWSTQILTLMFFGSISWALAQAPIIELQKSLGGSSNDFARGVILASDGNYIIAGGSSSNNGNVTGNHGSSDFWVVKMNPSGVVIWQKSLGGPGFDFAKDIKQTSDGGYILTGIASGNGGDVTGNHGLWDVWVVKLNANGILQWQKSLGGSANDGGSSVEQTSDGGYIVAAYSESSDGDVSDAIDYIDYWVVKLSASGTLQWEKSFGGSEIDYATSIALTLDGGYIVSGFSDSTNGHVTGNHGAEDFWVVKITANGDLQWQSTYGGSSQDVGNNVLPTQDGGYIISGFTSSNNGDVSGNNGNSDFWLVKTNSTGAIEWQKTLGGSSSEFAYALQKVNNGYVVAGGSSSSNGDVTENKGSEDFWVARVNSIGELQWQKSMGGNDDDEAHAINSTNDGGFVVAGFSYSNNGDVTGNHGSNDMWVVKLSQDPLAIVDFQFQEIVLYPNPVSEVLYIEAQQDIENISVFNLLGQELLKQSVNGLQSTIDMSGLSGGIYLIQILSSQGAQTYKIQKR